ncbi:MAG TPA: sulfurtransferase [Anaerolineaceae bacterium]|nr:sulfurtransferase [Anaerolineaceae bacterium]
MPHLSTFITCEELFSNYQSDDFVIIDCRFDLSDPSWGFHDYLKAHIPKAIFADLDNDLSGEKNEFTGRHPLPSTKDFVNTCSSWGIDSSKKVIVYDTSSGSFAARLWWMLNYYGHSNVAILEGGFPAWIKLGFPVEAGKVTSKPSQFSGTTNKNMLVTTSEMEEIIQTKNKRIIDARSPERYSGKEEPIDKIAGRIPNSINFFHQNNLTEEGNLLPHIDLLTEYDQLLGQSSSQEVVMYCGSGVTSCFNIAVMQHIGKGIPRLYLGSWSEWITNPNNPIVNDSSKYD